MWNGGDALDKGKKEENWEENEKRECKYACCERTGEMTQRRFGKLVSKHESWEGLCWSGEEMEKTRQETENIGKGEIFFFLQ